MKWGEAGVTFRHTKLHEQILHLQCPNFSTHSSRCISYSSLRVRGWGRTSSPGTGPPSVAAIMGGILSRPGPTLQLPLLQRNVAVIGSSTEVDYLLTRKSSRTSDEGPNHGTVPGSSLSVPVSLALRRESKISLPGVVSEVLAILKSSALCVIIISTFVGAVFNVWGPQVEKSSSKGA